MDADKLLERAIALTVSLPVLLLWVEIIAAVSTYLLGWLGISLSYNNVPDSISQLLYSLFLLALWSVLPTFLLALVLVLRKKYALGLFCMASIGLYFVFVIEFDNWDGIV